MIPHPNAGRPNRILLFLFVALGASSLVAQDSRPDAAQVRTRCETLRREAGVPGMQIVVVRRGEVLFSAALGTADLEHDVPVAETTRFRTASIAKPMTATAALRLYEQGRLDLDADIRT